VRDRTPPMTAAIPVLVLLAVLLALVDGDEPPEGRW
jgi:hypothetical protein